jgi:site-specific DNA-methyltransferase (adenine-specific)
MMMVEKQDVECIFADPPDNIDLGYGEYKDKMPDHEYIQLLRDWTFCFVESAWTTWISFNAKWTLDMAVIAKAIQASYPEVKVKPCVQVFTFGQHNNHDFGNNHRPLWRFQWPEGTNYPKQIKVPSWRQLNGDKRAKPGGRVPGDVIATKAEHVMLQPGTVFDFPRVTGNSKQRRSWHPTQLHEELVERCIKSCTLEGELVIDPFAGTGTTMRVCKRSGRSCVTMDVDRSYCEKIVADNKLPRISEI